MAGFGAGTRVARAAAVTLGWGAPALVAVSLWSLATAPLTAQQTIRLESVNEGVSFRDLSYAPAGGGLAFISNRSGTWKIWLLEEEDAGPRLLLEDDGSESELAWSPDGRRLAFVRPTEEGTDIWTVDRSGAAPRRITEDEADEHDLAWSPDGGRIAFLSARAGHQDLHLVELRDGHVRQLTRETNPWDEFRWAPAWSPDGRRLAYVSNRSGLWKQELWVVDASDGTTRKVTTDLDVMTSPVWSPDGRHMAFNAVKRHEFWWGDQTDIYLVRADDLSVRKLAMNAFVSDRNGSIPLVWAPDGEAIFFRREWEGDANLWRVPVEGGVATKLTYEAGSFGDYDVSPDGRHAVYDRSTPTHGAELRQIARAGGRSEPLTAWSPVYRDVRAPRRVAFRSTDGLYILGYLYLPPDFDPAGSYPALVQVHGGGNNAYGNGFHVLEHVLSHAGFVVLAIEYRGSAGHGRAFQKLSLGSWAAEQGWDAVAAARFLESRPWSNGRVGIYGGSYGGIMTLAALTRTAEPFDAAAPLYGIYDWETAFEHGDYLMRFWIVEGHLGFAPGEHPALYERTATLRHLEVVDRDLPFLILHGEEDRRAPFQQSVALAEALRARGNPVEFVSYPGERHGFRRPETRLDAYGRLLDFFRAHLMEAGAP